MRAGGRRRSDRLVRERAAYRQTLAVRPGSECGGGVVLDTWQAVAYGSAYHGPDRPDDLWLPGPSRRVPLGYGSAVPRAGWPSGGAGRLARPRPQRGVRPTGASGWRASHARGPTVALRRLHERPGSLMRDDLIRQAAGRLNDGVPLAEVEDELGVEFTADELVAVGVRRCPYTRHEWSDPTPALIEERRRREQTARAEAESHHGPGENRLSQAALNVNLASLRVSRVALDVAALVGLGMVAAALYTARQTVKETHFTAGVQTLPALHQESESEPMHQTRARAAKQLLKGEESRDLDDILDFFETVAVLVRRDAVDVELAWQTLSYWIDGYATAAKRFVEEEQRATPSVWQELDGLRARFDAFEHSTGHVPDAPIDPKAFLRYESTLRRAAARDTPGAPPPVSGPASGLGPLGTGRSTGVRDGRAVPLAAYGRAECRRGRRLARPTGRSCRSAVRRAGSDRATHARARPTRARA